MIDIDYIIELNTRLFCHKTDKSLLIIKNQNVSFTEFYFLLNQIKNTAMYLLVV